MCKEKEEGSMRMKFKETTYDQIRPYQVKIKEVFDVAKGLKSTVCMKTEMAMMVRAKKNYNQ